ncbi:hypothetical protein [Vibrio sp. St2]|uniref:hypothetical protein n=1 Tax=Vibrio sp. St2 TaxID=2853441 RepID=UPI00248D5289|nr:hypothetical protein [Vibrio sp. St2]
MKKLTIEEVQAKWQDEWMKVDGVIGVGITESNKTPCLVVYSACPEVANRKLPFFIDGIKVIVEKTSRFDSL